MRDNTFWKKLKEYFAIYLPKQRNSSEKTINTFQMAWNLILRFLINDKKLLPKEITFKTFSSETIIEFLDVMEKDKNWTVSTRNNRLSCIRSFFKFATYTCPDAYLIYVDLCTVPLKKGVDHSRVINHMSKDSISTILGCININTPKGLRDRFFITLMYDTGARDGEMLKLKLSDINVETATVYLFGKGSKPRLVPISKETIIMFCEYKKIFHRDNRLNTPLFYTKHMQEKTPMSDDNVARFIKKYAKLAREKNPNVPSNVHPHMFRHSRAMHLYQDGMPLAILSEFLGHADPETTLIYAYADTEMKRKAIKKATNSFLLEENDEHIMPIWENKDIIDILLKGY